jgi:hypothetical protein
MNNIVPIVKADACMDLSTLEAVLMDLTKYGKPRVSCQDGMTWYCAVDVFVTGTGIDFKVASDFQQITPLNAAQQCHERLREAMKNIADKVKK